MPDFCGWCGVGGVWVVCESCVWGLGGWRWRVSACVSEGLGLQGRTPETIIIQSTTKTTHKQTHVLRERAEVGLHGVVRIELRGLADVEGPERLGRKDGDHRVLEGVGEGEFAWFGWIDGWMGWCASLGV